MPDYIASNRALWNTWTAQHLETDHHRDVARFRATGSSLRPIERAELGDVAGKSLLHLQCNMGCDTLSWARLGARVTGFDPAPDAVRRAVERGAVDVAAAEPAAAVADADVVVVAAPVGALPAAVREALELAGPDCVVTDVGSVKRAIVAAHAPGTPKYGAPVPYCLTCQSVRDRWAEDQRPDDWPCDTLRHLAAVWSDHHQYRPEWAPDA